MRTIALALVCSAAAMPTVVCAQDDSSSSDVIRVERRCVVQLINEVNIPAEANGKLTLVEGIDRGANVKAGQLMATIDDQQAKLTLNLKQAEEAEQRMTAENDVNIRAAKKAKELAESIAESTLEMFNQKVASRFDRDQKMLEAERAALSVELAETEQQKARSILQAKEAETELAEYAVQQRQLKAPFDGVIFRKSVSTGEWVEPGTPVLTIIDLVNLKVVGDIDARNHDVQSLYGRPVTVEVRISQSEVKRFSGKITYVNPKVEIDNTVMIEAEIENAVEQGRWVALPGMSAVMLIEKDPRLAAKP